MNKKALVTGATGLIGKKIIPILLKKDYDITVLTRNIESAKLKLKIPSLNFVNWGYKDSSDIIINYIDGCDLIINLAGASIGEKRWNDKYKKIIYDSRVLTTIKIAEAISKSSTKPNTFISSSAIGYYGTTGEETLTENFGSGDDFISKLCSDWEKNALDTEKYGVRVITTRTGIVLDRNEGALKKFLMPFKFFVGGYQGSGKQWISWIHIEDFINLILFAIENENIKGALNCTTEFPVTNKEFAKTLGKVIRKPSFARVPEFVLKIVVGEFSEYLLKGRRVIPEKAISNGFKFKYATLEKALENLLR